MLQSIESQGRDHWAGGGDRDGGYQLRPMRGACQVMIPPQSLLSANPKNGWTRRYAHAKSPVFRNTGPWEILPSETQRRVRRSRASAESDYLRWRILLRIFRFFRPIFRRPLPVFLTPISPALPSSVVSFGKASRLTREWGGKDSSLRRNDQGTTPRINRIWFARKIGADFAVALGLNPPNRTCRSRIQTACHT